jgi:hypothetical protein
VSISRADLDAVSDQSGRIVVLVQGVVAVPQGTQVSDIVSGAELVDEATGGTVHHFGLTITSKWD